MRWFFASLLVLLRLTISVAVDSGTVEDIVGNSFQKFARSVNIVITFSDEDVVVGDSVAVLEKNGICDCRAINSASASLVSEIDDNFKGYYDFSTATASSKRPLCKKSVADSTDCTLMAAQITIQDDISRLVVNEISYAPVSNLYPLPLLDGVSLEIRGSAISVADTVSFISTSADCTVDAAVAVSTSTSGPINVVQGTGSVYYADQDDTDTALQTMDPNTYQVCYKFSASNWEETGVYVLLQNTVTGIAFNGLPSKSLANAPLTDNEIVYTGAALSVGDAVSIVQSDVECSEGGPDVADTVTEVTDSNSEVFSRTFSGFSSAESYRVCILESGSDSWMDSGITVTLIHEIIGLNLVSADDTFLQAISPVPVLNGVSVWVDGELSSDTNEIGFVLDTGATSSLCRSEEPTISGTLGETIDEAIELDFSSATPDATYEVCWKSGSAWEGTGLRISVHSDTDAASTANVTPLSGMDPLDVTIDGDDETVLRVGYTVDGSTPVCDADADGVPLVLTLTETTLVRVRGCDDTNTYPSDIVDFEVAVAVQTPELTATSGLDPVQAEIETATSAAFIVVTTDGSDPDCDVASTPSPMFLKISESSTVRARACKEGLGDSDIVSAEVVVTVNAPVIPELYSAGAILDMTSDTSSASIWYSLDGTDPLCEAPFIEENETPLVLETTTTVKAVACKDGLEDSDITEQLVTITDPPTIDTFTPYVIPAEISGWEFQVTGTNLVDDVVIALFTRCSSITDETELRNQGNLVTSNDERTEALVEFKTPSEGTYEACWKYGFNEWSTFGSEVYQVGNAEVHEINPAVLPMSTVGLTVTITGRFMHRLMSVALAVPEGTECEDYSPPTSALLQITDEVLNESQDEAILQLTTQGIEGTFELCFRQTDAEDLQPSFFDARISRPLIDAVSPLSAIPTRIEDFEFKIEGPYIHTSFQIVLQDASLSCDVLLSSGTNPDSVSDDFSQGTVKLSTFVSPGNYHVCYRRSSFDTYVEVELVELAIRDSSFDSFDPPVASASHLKFPFNVEGSDLADDIEIGIATPEGTPCGLFSGEGSVLKSVAANRKSGSVQLATPLVAGYYSLCHRRGGGSWTSFSSEQVEVVETIIETFGVTAAPTDYQGRLTVEITGQGLHSALQIEVLGSEEGTCLEFVRVSQQSVVVTSADQSTGTIDLPMPEEPDQLKVCITNSESAGEDRQVWSSLKLPDGWPVLIDVGDPQINDVSPLQSQTNATLTMELTGQYLMLDTGIQIAFATPEGASCSDVASGGALVVSDPDNPNIAYANITTPLNDGLYSICWKLPDNLIVIPNVIHEFQPIGDDVKVHVQVGFAASISPLVIYGSGNTQGMATFTVNGLHVDDQMLIALAQPAGSACLDYDGDGVSASSSSLSVQLPVDITPGLYEPCFKRKDRRDEPYQPIGLQQICLGNQFSRLDPGYKISTTSSSFLQSGDQQFFLAAMRDLPSFNVSITTGPDTDVFARVLVTLQDGTVLVSEDITFSWCSWHFPAEVSFNSTAFEGVDASAQGVLQIITLEESQDISYNATSLTVQIIPPDQPVKRGVSNDQTSLHVASSSEQHDHGFDDDSVDPLFSFQVGSNSVVEGGESLAIFITVLGPPSSTYEVQVFTTNPSELEVSVEDFTVTTENWEIPILVAVTGVDDPFDDGDETVYVVCRTPEVDHSLDIEVKDNDDSSVFFEVVSGRVTELDEIEGTYAIVNLQLASQPSDPVSLNLEVTLPDQAQISRDFFTFDVESWSTPQQVNVTGVRDNDNASGDIPFELMVTRYISEDPRYGNNTVYPNITLINENINFPQVYSVEPSVCPDEGCTLTIKGAYLESTIEVNGKILIAREAQIASSSASSSPTSSSGTSASTRRTLQDTVALASETQFWSELTFDLPLSVSGYQNITVVNSDGGSIDVSSAVFVAVGCEEEGMYGDEKTGCLECPEGAICPGGERVWPQNGFWSSHESVLGVTQCLAPAEVRCLGTRYSLCGMNYEGEFCERCVAGHFPHSGLCEQCDVEGTGFTLIATGAALFLAIISFSPLVMSPEMYDIIMWFIMQMQVLGIAGFLSNDKLPYTLRTFFSITSLFVFDLNYIRPQCWTDGGIAYWEIYLLTLVIMIGIMLPAAIGFPILRAARIRTTRKVAPTIEAMKLSEFLEVERTKADHYLVRQRRTFLQLLHFLFPILMIRSFQAVNCVNTAEGPLRLAEQLSTECYRGAHVFIGLISWMLLVGAVGVLVWGVRSVRANREKMSGDPGVQSLLSFIYEDFRVARYEFCLSEFGTLYITAASVGFLQAHPIAQASLVFVMVVGHVITLLVTRSLRLKVLSVMAVLRAAAGGSAIMVSIMAHAELLDSSLLDVMQFVVLGFAGLHLLAAATFSGIATLARVIQKRAERRRQAAGKEAWAEEEDEEVGGGGFLSRAANLRGVVEDHVEDEVAEEKSDSDSIDSDIEEFTFEQALMQVFDVGDTEVPVITELPHVLEPEKE